jgi:hypothetical protein
MQIFSLENKPETIPYYRKKTTVQLLFVAYPFQVETQEGVMTISPQTVDDWDGGYYVAYPDDGSPPYSISPSFVRNNYERV